MKQDLTTELFYNGGWNTTKPYVRDPLTITRGKNDEQGGVVPSTLSATLKNKDGSNNPKNPLSPLYGAAGRNTPMRTYLGTPHLGDDNSSKTSTTSHVAPSVTAAGGGLLLCGWSFPTLDIGSYTVPGTMTDAGDGASIFSKIQGARQVIASAGATGTRTATNTLSASYVACSVFINGPTSISTGSLTAVGDSFPLDGNPGDWWVLLSSFATVKTALGEVATVVDYPSDTDGGGWVLLADTGDVKTTNLDVPSIRMKAWAKRVHTENASHTISLVGAGSDSTITLAYRIPAAEVTGDWDIRGMGEVASWKPDRTVDFNQATGKGDAWTGIEAGGILRRLGQGTDPLVSPIRRAVLDQTTIGAVAAYWPGEDGSGATQVASALPGGEAMTIDGGGTINFGGSTAFGGSAPLLVLTENTNLHGKVPATPNTTGSLFLRFLIGFPTAGYADDLNIINMYLAGGSADHIGFRWDTDANGAIWIDAIAVDGTLLDTWGISFAPAGGLNGKNVLVGLTLDQTGSDIFLEIDVVFLNADGSVSSLGLGHTFTGLTLGRAREFTIGAFGQMDGTTLGHVVVSNIEDVLHIDTDATLSVLQGWAGETAAARLVRLGAENHINVSVIGDPDETSLMGAQPVDTLVNILAECERTDGGMLFEPRGSLGLAYRTRTSLYNQTTALELDWTNRDVAPPLTPVIDDLPTRNDVTAKRTNGSSARVVQETGPLNVNAPANDPEGVGRYETEIKVNPKTDDALADLAGWYLHLGTIDETRFSQITVDLVAAPGLATSAVDIGDRIDVVNLPMDLSSNDLSLIVVGYTETIESHHRTITFNCAPYAPYQVAEADGDPRVDTDGTERQASSGTISTTQANITFFTTNDEFWTTDAADFPFAAVMGGELVTVTAIAAPLANDSQLFTVTRSVNGVVKSHPVGTKIHVLNPAHAPL